MAYPQVVDGGDGLQIWRVAANILSKDSVEVDMEWSSSLGVGRVMKCYKGSWTWPGSLDEGTHDSCERNIIIT
jgi:hypothetical protein